MKWINHIFIGVLFFMGSVVMANDFEEFLDDFIPKVAAKELQMNKLHWIAETTSAPDAFDLLASMEVEYNLLFSDNATYEKLLTWQKDKTIKDPLLLRQLNILIRSFKANMIPKELMEKTAKANAEIMCLYNTFRPTLHGKSMSENDIIDILKKDKSVPARKEAWALSKEIGVQLAMNVRKIVKLRNEAAHLLGYRDFFDMVLQLQEIDEAWLFKTFEALNEKSKKAYEKTINDINVALAKRYNVNIEDIGPWAFCDPFAQEDPLSSNDLDASLKDKDMVVLSKQFYAYMGFDIEDVIKKSDLYERVNKNQHAFCTDIDRKYDVRTLQNVKSTIRCMDTLLHEFGHAVYSLGYDMNMPWLLREIPSNVITTEAMALFAGRQAYSSLFFHEFLKINDRVLIDKAMESQKRRQLLFSRWVFVMTNFEKELYRDPDQDLNGLWWSLVEKYQLIKAPKDRIGKEDWAAKYHISLAPVYYHSYLIGELFASSLDKLFKQNGKNTGKILKEKFFFKGDSIRWDETIFNVLDRPLSLDDWLEQYGQ
jgi:peptidyl-dipeptidase A